MRFIYVPTVFCLTLPIAALPWGAAHILWIALIVAGLIFASFLIWDIGAEYAPLACGALIGCLLLNSELLVVAANSAGIAISLCAVAVWCFFRGRYEAVGVVCLAIALAVKPHDTGLVWLYFLLAGGVYRRRALQSLGTTIAVSLPGIVWLWHVAPHCRGRWRSSIVARRGSCWVRGEQRCTWSSIIYYKTTTSSAARNCWASAACSSKPAQADRQNAGPSALDGFLPRFRRQSRRSDERGPVVRPVKQAAPDSNRFSALLATARPRLRRRLLFLQNLGRYWKSLTGDRVEYAPYQSAAKRFPDVPRADFQRAVQYFEGGTRYSGAEAVFHLMASASAAPLARAALALPELPGFAAVTEAHYRVIAAHRNAGYRVTARSGASASKPHVQHRVLDSSPGASRSSTSSPSSLSAVRSED